MTGSTIHPDPVQSRVAAPQQRTHSEELQALVPTHSAFDFDSNANHRTHPGDILYWVAYLGGASLLLLFATR